MSAEVSAELQERAETPDMHLQLVKVELHSTHCSSRVVKRRRDFKREITIRGRRRAEAAAREIIIKWKRAARKVTLGRGKKVTRIDAFACC